VYGVEKPTGIHPVEDQVKLDNTSFIDGNIAATHVLIEQKSLDKDLKKPIKQSDGSLLNPSSRQNAMRRNCLIRSGPRWIVTCNFRSFLIYDMEKPNGDREEILLANLSTEYYRLKFSCGCPGIATSKKRWKSRFRRAIGRQAVRCVLERVQRPDK
jgi:hypothetical protein